MKSIYIFVLFIVSFSVFAERNMQDEITHLSMFVAKTECVYERNGVMYSGENAIEHIVRKYEYYRDDIQTTEDFIKYSATKSKLTGKNYQVRCVGKPVITSKKWLLSELKKYRMANN